MKNFFSVVLAVVIALSCTVAAFAGKTFLYPSDVIPEGDMRIIAHRGYSAIAPENTIPAFRLAGENGFWGAECDISSTKDGVWIISHDNTIDRMTDGRGKIEELTYDEIMKYKINSGNNINKYSNLKMPTLEEYLDVCKEYGLHAVIEIKHNSANNYNNLAELLNAREEKDNFTIISFSEEALLDVQRLMPDTNLFYLYSEDDLHWLDFCKEHNIGADLNYKLLTKDNVEKANAAGINLMAWTVDDKTIAEDLFGLGIKEITSNSLVAQKSFGAYDRVFIIGVDGAGRFFKEAETPNFDRIFKDGAVDYTARAEMITVSAQNWGSILTGVSYIQHGLTNNKAGSAQRTSETKYPSIFTYVRKAFPDAQLASFVNWNPINYGIIENDINVYKVQNGDDEKLTEEICNYFSEGNAPKLFYAHFDSVDHIGHEEGSKSEKYLKQIEIVDGYIGRIYDSIAENGLIENSLFIVVDDHGEMISGGHWGLTMRETNTTLAVKGKTVVKGANMDMFTRNRDTAAIVLYALGIERPSNMTARLPGNLFDGVDGETRPFFKDLPDSILSAFAWIITLCTFWI